MRAYNRNFQKDINGFVSISLLRYFVKCCPGNQGFTMVKKFQHISPVVLPPKKDDQEPKHKKVKYKNKLCLNVVNPCNDTKDASCADHIV